MAALPKVDSAGLRLAKMAAVERVSSVSAVKKEEGGREPASSQTIDTANGRPPVSTGNRRISG